MIQSIYFDYKFTTLNEYINAERSNRYKAAGIKQRETNYTYLLVKSLMNGKKLKEIDKPVKLNFIWHEKNKKRDPDNVAFCKKFILDGMVKAKLITNDGHKQIVSLTDEFVFDGKYGVEVRWHRVEE